MIQHCIGRVLELQIKRSVRERLRIKNQVHVQITGEMFFLLNLRELFFPIPPIGLERVHRIQPVMYGRPSVVNELTPKLHGCFSVDVSVRIQPEKHIRKGRECHRVADEEDDTIGFVST